MTSETLLLAAGTERGNVQRKYIRALRRMPRPVTTKLGLLLSSRRAYHIFRYLAFHSYSHGCSLVLIREFSDNSQISSHSHQRNIGYRVFDS
jgi:hypothetical protein